MSSDGANGMDSGLLAMLLFASSSSVLKMNLSTIVFISSQRGVIGDSDPGSGEG